MRSGWWRFWRRHERRGLRVVVYTRADCPLCDEAARFLEGERQRLHFALEYVDVDRNEAMRRQHGDSVPVVEIDGQVRFRGHINEVLWRRLVEAAGSE